MKRAERELWSSKPVCIGPAVFEVVKRVWTISLQPEQVWLTRAEVARRKVARSWYSVQEAYAAR